MLTLVVYFILACSVVYLIAKELWKRWVLRWKGFNIPPTHVLFGHSLQIPTDPTGVLLTVRDFMLENNREVLLFLGPQPMFLTGNPNHAEILLNSTKTISKSFEYSFLVPWLGTGLLISDGSKWKTRRRLLTPAFHYGILDDFAEVFQEQSDIFIKTLKPLAESGEKFNICPYATNCTLDVICETAMGVKIGAQVDSETEYTKAVLSISGLIQQRQIRAYLWPDFIYNLTSSGRKHNEAVKILHNFTLKVIKDRVKSRKLKQNDKQDDKQEPPAKKRLSFLDILMESFERGEIDMGGLREEVDTFMFEGHDTTAAGLFWTFYLLGRHPDVMKKAQEEVDRVWGSRGNKSLLDLSKEYEYLACILKESLRLYPSVPLFARATHENIDIGKGLTLPSGSTFNIATFMVHRNPEYWEDPDDFKPERFFPENIKNRHPFSFIPFSAGPRNCIGQKFALLEEKIVVATFLRHYDITSFEEPDDLEMCAEIILRTKNGLQVKITKRS